MKPEQLLQSGFKFVGEWLADGEGIKTSERMPKKVATVYAFLVDGELVYIGLTQTCLYQRMNGYRNGQETQRTNIRVRGQILEALKAGSRVQILAASPEPAFLPWNDLPVSVAVGLESGLIAALKPRWNMLNNKGGDCAAVRP